MGGQTHPEWNRQEERGQSGYDVDNCHHSDDDHRLQDEQRNVDDDEEEYQETVHCPDPPCCRLRDVASGCRRLAYDANPSCVINRR